MNWWGEKKDAVSVAHRRVCFPKRYPQSCPCLADFVRASTPWHVLLKCEMWRQALIDYGLIFSWVLPGSRIVAPKGCGTGSLGNGKYWFQGNGPLQSFPRFSPQSPHKQLVPFDRQRTYLVNNGSLTPTTAGQRYLLHSASPPHIRPAPCVVVEETTLTCEPPLSRTISQYPYELR